MASYSGLWDGVYGDSYSLLVDKPSVGKKIDKFLRRSRNGSRELRELMLTLIGASAGSTAADSYLRAAHTVAQGLPAANGGLRTMETRTIINRATTAGDVTATKALIAGSSAPTYPVDKSGNGGGGNLTKTFPLG